MEDEELVQRVRRWVETHRVLSVSVIVFLVVAGFFASEAGTFTRYSAGKAMETSVVRDRGVSESVPDIGEAGGQDDFQVRTGHATVESEDAASDVSTFRGKVSALSGEIESEEKQVSETEVTYHVTARIPVEAFDMFATWLQATYMVEDMSLRTETVSVEQQRNQVRVLRQALNTYDNLLSKLNQSSAEEINADTVQAIAEITEKKRHVAQELERLGYSIGEVEEQAAMSTVRVTFREEKPVDIQPEDTKRRFRLAWKRSVDSFMDTAAELSALPVTVGELFLHAVKYIIYVFVVVVPAYFAYRGLRWVLKRLSRIGR